MADFTRRTHVVRVSLDAPNPDPAAPPPDPSVDPTRYVDVEVLDAISFRIGRGEEVILNMDTSNSNPLIIDDTGGKHDQTPDTKPTQRTHMKRIKSDDNANQLDVEVVDVVAFRDQRGEEWILDMQATTGEGPAIFDETDSSGSNQSTRRMHDEKVSDPFNITDDPTNKNFVTMQRCDAIAFRKVRGEEVILVCPSADDKSGDRAPTHITPDGYDPSDDTANAVKPPSLKKSGDKHNYVCAVKDINGFFTGKAKINMGPFWWIRKIKGGGFSVTVCINAQAFGPGLHIAAPDITVDVGTDPQVAHAVLVDTQRDPEVRTSNPGFTLDKFFVWSNIAPFPTLDTYANVIIPGQVAYMTQFAQQIHMDASGFTIPVPNFSASPGGFPVVLGGGNSAGSIPYSGSGEFGSIIEAGDYAHAFNVDYSARPGAEAVHQLTGYYSSDGVEIGEITAPPTVFAASLEVVNDGPTSSVGVNVCFTLTIPTAEVSFDVHVNGIPAKTPNSFGAAGILADGGSDGADFTFSDDSVFDAGVKNRDAIFHVKTKVVDNVMTIIVSGGDPDIPPPIV